MVLTPDDVERQEFATAWRGYNRQEVDRFLDLIAASIAQLVRDRDEAGRRAEEVERDASDTLATERLLKRALVDAQRVADETVAEARRTAEEIVADARSETEAERERARAQVAGIRQAVEELHRLRSEYSDRVRAMVQRVEELPPLPEALDQLVERTQSARPPREEIQPPPEPPARAEIDAVLPPVQEDDVGDRDHRPDGPPAPPWM